MKKLFPYILVIFLFAFFLRVQFLPQKALTFGYDQARDAINIGQIIKGDLKILGPSASTPGFYHGVFYYYLLVPAYLLGQGSPVIAAYWIAFLNSLTVFIVFYLAYLLTKNKWVGILSGILFAVSFESTQYATWLSNPTIGIWTVPMIYLGMWLWTKEKNNFGPVITALGLGLSIQSEIFLLYHIVPIFIWLYLNRKVVSRRHLLFFGFSLLTALSTMIISEVKFGFKGLGGIGALALGNEQNLAYAKSLGDFLVLYLNQIGRIFAFNSYPGNIGYAGALVIFLALFGIYKGYIWAKFLSLWLFSHLSVVTMGGTSTPFLMVGIGPAVSILLGIYISNFFSNKNFLAACLLLGIITYSNLSFIFKENSRGSTLFAIQKDMILSKEIGAIDYTYDKSEGKEFGINSLTSPLWMNVTWTYLYKWHGMDKYGYLPYFLGMDQVGQIDSLPQKDKILNQHFLILEPMGGIPIRYLDETQGYENSRSKVVETKNWGELLVEYRNLK